MKRRYYYIVLAWMVPLFLGLFLWREADRGAVRTAAATATASPQYVTLVYTVDRSALPLLTFNELTLLIHVGDVTAVHVVGDDKPIPFEYDRASGTVMVTSDVETLRLLLVNPATLDGVGEFEKAVLKNDWRWAWSHGLDDNVYLTGAIEAFERHGWRATLFMIAKDVSDTRDDTSWIIDAAPLQRLLARGWSVGNHTWDHQCDETKVKRETVVQGYERLREVIDGSERPDYRLISFAAPCFKSAYHPIIKEMVAEGITEVQFNESGSDFRVIVDPGAVTYTVGARNAVPFSYNRPIGRDPSIDVGLEQALDQIEWIVTHTAPDRHLWYNTISHGSDEELDEVLEYVFYRYGPGGPDEVWVAPSDEIYSYLLVRDRSVVTFNGPTSLNQSPANALRAVARLKDVILNWDDSSGAGWYQIHYDRTAYFTPTYLTVAATVWGTEAVYTDTNVLAGNPENYYAVHLLHEQQDARSDASAWPRVGTFSFDLLLATGGEG